MSSTGAIRNLATRRVLLVCAIAAVLPLFASCEDAKRAAPPPSPPVKAVTRGFEISVWYATTRAETRGSAGQVAYKDEVDPEFKSAPNPRDVVHYGRAKVFVPITHEPGTQASPLWRRIVTGFDERLVLRSVEALSVEASASDIRSAIDASGRPAADAFVYVHGYNTSFRDAALRAGQLGFDLRVRGITALFSWPSYNSEDQYGTDGERCEESAIVFADFLERLSQNPKIRRVDVVAHSMGNRALLRAVNEVSKRTGISFGQIILAAPDVSPPLFRQLAVEYPRLASRTTLYVSHKDVVLRYLSKWKNDSERVGYYPPLTLVDRIDTIDISECGDSIVGHSDFAESPEVISDMRRLFETGASPSSRPGIVSTNEKTFWKMIPARVPLDQ